MMHQLLVKLCPGTGESGIWLALPEALAIAMIEGDITYRGPTVLNEYSGLELGHGFMVLVFITKVVKNHFNLMMSVQRVVGLGLR